MPIDDIWKPTTPQDLARAVHVEHGNVAEWDRRILDAKRRGLTDALAVAQPERDRHAALLALYVGQQAVTKAPPSPPGTPPRIGILARARRIFGGGR